LALDGACSTTATAADSSVGEVVDGVVDELEESIEVEESISAIVARGASEMMRQREREREREREQRHCHSCCSLREIDGIIISYLGNPETRWR